MVTGGHLGFMQIRKVAQSCRLGNQFKFVIEPHANTNHSKNFIGKHILAFRHIKPTISFRIPFCLPSADVPDEMKLYKPIYL